MNLEGGSSYIHLDDYIEWNLPGVIPRIFPLMFGYTDTWTLQLLLGKAGRPSGVPASDVEMGWPGGYPRVEYEAWPGILSPCRKSSRQDNGVTSFVSLCLLPRAPNPLRFGYLIRGASGLIALTITWA